LAVDRNRRLQDHAGADCIVVALVDDDERAGAPVSQLGIGRTVAGKFEGDLGDIVYSAYWAGLQACLVSSEDPKGVLLYTAVSSPKCNELMIVFKEVERFWHRQFSGAWKVEALARPSIELPSHGVELCLREAGEIRALGEILAE